MDPFVFAAMLFAAACHAGWNAVVKLGVDPFTAVALITIAGVPPALIFLPFAGSMAPEAWPWLIASVMIHFVYYIGLTEAYRTGDMGQVYPIARGSAPLMTAVVSTFYLGEVIAPLAWLGIVVLVAGVFLLSLRGGRDLTRIDRRAVGFALLAAVAVCCYSIVDGLGARASGNPFGYIAWLFVVDGLAMLVFALARRGAALMRAMVTHWRGGLFGGALSMMSYGIAIWAMTVAPIAIVAALRETSVLFAAAFAVILLKEPLRATRIVAAMAIVCGLALIRLA